jgi:hypothetical protein
VTIRPWMVFGLLGAVVVASIVISAATKTDEPTESPYCDQPRTWVATAGRHEGGPYRVLVERMNFDTLEKHRFWVTCS